VPDIQEGRIGGLGEDRRRFPRGAEIDRADVERFEQRWAGGKLGPGDLATQRLKPMRTTLPAACDAPDTSVVARAAPAAPIKCLRLSVMLAFRLV
jgi:hypothetical protein